MWYNSKATILVVCKRGLPSFTLNKKKRDNPPTICAFCMEETKPASSVKKNLGFLLRIKCLLACLLAFVRASNIMINHDGQKCQNTRNTEHP